MELEAEHRVERVADAFTLERCGLVVAGAVRGVRAGPTAARTAPAAGAVGTVGVPHVAEVELDACHGGADEQGAQEDGTAEDGAGQVGVGEVGVGEVGVGEVGVGEVGVGEVGTLEGYPKRAAGFLR